VLERQTRGTPFEIYARALQTLTSDLERNRCTWGDDQSPASTRSWLPYQHQSTGSRRAKQWRGGFNWTSVPEKTFVGLCLPVLRRQRAPQRPDRPATTGERGLETGDRAPPLISHR